MAKKSITITLYTSELVYDIQNKTYITGRSRRGDNNFEQVANMQVNDDDENANQILRSIGNAAASLRGKLGEYLADTNALVDDKLMDATKNIFVKLLVPSNYNENVTDSVTASLHQYVVNTAVADWFVMTNKEDAANYYTASANNIAEIRDSINRRVRPQRSTI